jgi:gliding motility-associated lipoprotein GldK
MVMKMLFKRGFMVVSAAFLLSSCGGGYNGELIGALNRPLWNHVMPYGMVYVPSGSLHIGPSDQDIFNHLWQRSKPISIQGFYMDETEISNNEYRQFVYWVRDSIAHKLIGEDHLIDEGEITEHIDWDMRIDWEDEEYVDILEEMFYPENERFWGQKDIDTRKLIFEYSYEDLKGAARNRDKPRSEFIIKGTIPIYPDTLCWIRDFTYSYNEPWTRNYFWHPSFDNYPVVGVTWEQANAFANWRSFLWNGYRLVRGDVAVDYFRLPYESEWEYAARGGKLNAPYPWGGPYIRNTKGCILANFKPGRGSYMEDGGFYTVRVDAYWPNDFGLYNMAGNVAEWTSTAFYENSYAFVHDLNSDITYEAQEGDPITMKRKVIRGGSWKDIAYYCQTGARAYEYQDTSKSYVGFRNVVTFLGRSIDDATR